MRALSKRHALCLTVVPSSGQMGGSTDGALTSAFHVTVSAQVFKRAAIFTCGPESLMFDAQREATTRGMAFHMEEFRW